MNCTIFFPTFAIIRVMNIMQRLHCELSDSKMRVIPESGHLPHVEKPVSVAQLIEEFARDDNADRPIAKFSGLEIPAEAYSTP